MLADVSFSQVVLLYPLAPLAHVWEEWPGFPRWARAFASPRYSDREYIRTHVGTVVISLAATALVVVFPRPGVVVPFLALVFGPAVFCNALFHVAASVEARAYCPGAVTGVVLYLPLSMLLTAVAVREGLVSGSTLLGVLALSAVMHTVEVGHNVFKRW